jgi:hypothetical protein
MIYQDVHFEIYNKSLDLIKRYINLKLDFDDSFEQKICSIIDNNAKRNVHTLFTYHLFKIFDVSEKRALLFASIISILELKKYHDFNERKIQNDASNIHSSILHVVSHILMRELKLSERVKFDILLKFENYKIKYDLILEDYLFNRNFTDINSLNVNLSKNIFDFIISILDKIKVIDQEQFNSLMLLTNTISILISNSEQNVLDIPESTLSFNQIKIICNSLGEEFMVLYNMIENLKEQAYLDNENFYSPHMIKEIV